MRDTRRRLRWFWQRRTRGFDDTALWNLDSHLAALILPRLKAFRSLPPAGYPSGLFSDPPDITCYEDWLAIIDQMVDAFELLADKDTSSWEWTDTQHQTMETGLQLFARWFGALWD